MRQRWSKFDFTDAVDKGQKLPVAYLGQAAFSRDFRSRTLLLFGAERRGAPVVSFTRLGNEPIDQRGYIDEPNLVVVIDDSLLKEGPGQVFSWGRANDADTGQWRPKCIGDHNQGSAARRLLLHRFEPDRAADNRAGARQRCGGWSRGQVYCGNYTGRHK